MSRPNDFDIRNNCLYRYTGPGGDVEIPDSVTGIGDKAFDMCDSLTSVTIPDSVTSIGSFAFCDCSSLTSITLPNSLTSIGFEAFAYCINLRSITIPKSVTSIGDDAFKFCKSLRSITIPEGVTKIGDYAFEYCVSLRSITLPESVTKIGGSAFENCASLRSITIPKGVTSIGDEAFYSCSSLTDVTLPDSVIRIGHRAFCNTGKAAFHASERVLDLIHKNDFIIKEHELKEYNGPGGDVIVPEGVTSIGDSAFYSCSSLRSITLPKGVAKIGDSAFEYCVSLRSITLPEAITSIGDSAFEKCVSLRSIAFSEGVTSIGKDAFQKCYNLRSITLLEGVTSVGDKAFYSCSGLTDVTLPDSVMQIGYRAFFNTGKAAFHASERVLDLIHKNDFIIKEHELKEYNGPGGDVIVPESVTSIDYCAFSRCRSLKSINIPEGVTSIGDSAFSACSGLKSFIMNGSKAKLTADMFGKTLPAGLVAQIGSMYANMADGALKQYVLQKDIWKKLDRALQAEIFMMRQGKVLEAAYRTIIKAQHVESLGEAILQRLEETPPGMKECNATAAYMSMFFGDISTGLFKNMYAALNTCKNGGKAVKAVQSDAVLMLKLNDNKEDDTSFSPEERRVIKKLATEKKSISSLEFCLKTYYKVSIDDLPKLQNREGKECNSFVFAWLLTAHEALKGSIMNNPDVIPAYEKSGIRPEVAEIVGMLDPEGFQATLMKLADEYLVAHQYTNKRFLAYPFCRYADESSMTELTKRAPKWASFSKGNSTPSLAAFRDAAMYSDTRVAMLFAERYHELDKYATLRGMTEDELRDKYLSDVGLDDQGGKQYDLGNQIVTARLQKDMNFLIELPHGKSSKSIPKKGADPKKYADADADFSEMKKNVKSILKNRGKVLLEDFLSGRPRSTAEWKTSYLQNPLMREVASLIVWSQEKNTFTLRDGASIDSAEQPYTITNEPICVAHPLEMTQVETETWQKYFATRSLKQPFQQIWEPIYKAGDIKEDRYRGCMIPLYRFLGQEKHGIYAEYYSYDGFWKHFHFTTCSVKFSECHGTAEMAANLTEKYSESGRVANDEEYTIENFGFSKYTRQVNHIVAYLDRVTVWDRVRKDDVSIINQMDHFTLAQITEFITAAQEAGATNVLAELLEYRNSHFADYDPMDGFTLEW